MSPIIVIGDKGHGKSCFIEHHIGLPIASARPEIRPQGNVAVEYLVLPTEDSPYALIYIIPRYQYDNSLWEVKRGEHSKYIGWRGLPKTVANESVYFARITLSPDARGPPGSSNGPRQSIVDGGFAGRLSGEEQVTFAIFLAERLLLTPSASVEQFQDALAKQDANSLPPSSLSFAPSAVSVTIMDKVQHPNHIIEVPAVISRQIRTEPPIGDDLNRRRFMLSKLTKKLSETDDHRTILCVQSWESDRNQGVTREILSQAKLPDLNTEIHYLWTMLDLGTEHGDFGDIARLPHETSIMVRLDAEPDPHDRDEVRLGRDFRIFSKHDDFKDWIQGARI